LALPLTLFDYGASNRGYGQPGRGNFPYNNRGNLSAYFGQEEDPPDEGYGYYGADHQEEMMDHQIEEVFDQNAYEQQPEEFNQAFNAIAHDDPFLGQTRKGCRMRSSGA